MFLASLYLDDGTLSISTRYNPNKNMVYCIPGIMIYTLNFLKIENEKLSIYLNTTFNTEFVVSKHPDGNGTLLKLNKVKDVEYFLRLILPIATQIPSMQYKTDISHKLIA